MLAITGERADTTAGGLNGLAATAGQLSRRQLPFDREKLSSTILGDVTSNSSAFCSAMEFVGRSVICKCRPVGNKRRMEIGNSRWLSWRYEARRQHEASCPYKQFEGPSWRHQLAIQLMPFMRKTVQLAFNATRRGGGYDIEFPIRVFSTVKRSESYIFRLFDAFPGRCNALVRKMSPEESDRAWFSQRTQTWFGGFEWDVPTVREHLVRVRRYLLEAEGNGLGSIGDKDESGHTVLYVSLRLGPFCH